MSAALTKLPTPGSPALAPTYIAEATPDGALDMPGSSVTDPFKIIPLKAFAAVYGGGNLAFYPGMPRVVSEGLYLQILAQGGAVAASKAWVVGGAPATGDTISIHVTYADATTETFSYTTLVTDTTAALAAAGLRAAVSSTKVAASGTGVNVVLTFKTKGSANNAATATSAATGGHTTITPTASGHFTGGTNGSLIE